MSHMNSDTDTRMAVLPANSLADLVDLADRARERLELTGEADWLTDALRGCVAQVRASQVVAPA